VICKLERWIRFFTQPNPNSTKISFQEEYKKCCRGR
jgi:hypothetical protein